MGHNHQQLRLLENQCLKCYPSTPKVLGPRDCHLSATMITLSPRSNLENHKQKLYHHIEREQKTQLDCKNTTLPTKKMVQEIVKHSKSTNKTTNSLHKTREELFLCSNNALNDRKEMCYL